MDVIDRWIRKGFKPVFVSDLHGFEVVIYYKYRNEPPGWLILTDVKWELVGNSEYRVWVSKQIKILMEREGIEEAQIN